MHRLLSALVFISSIAWSTLAGAQTSQGCATINGAASPLIVSAITVSSGNLFSAGDRVSAAVTAGPGNATNAELRVDGNVVDSTTLPGSLDYEIPADGTYILVFQALGGSVLDSTWNLSCASQPPTYPILVTVTGLVPSSPPGDVSNSIVLLNNGGDAITVVDNGTVSFPTELATGVGYDVTIDFPPDNQTCTVTNEMGTVGTAPVTTPTVTCDPPITPTPTPATPVPTLSAYGLVLTTIGLLIVAGGRLRSRKKS